MAHGIFAPALFIGGMLGGVIGILDVNLLNHPTNEIGAFALVGMGAVFAGVISAPITSVLIIFGTTGIYGLILPLKIASMTAYGLAGHSCPVAVYEALFEQDDIHLPHRSKLVAHALEQIRVSGATQADVIILQSNLTVAEACERVQNYEFTMFPVLDENSRCVGFVTEMRLRRNLAETGGKKLVREIADQCRTV